MVRRARFLAIVLVTVAALFGCDYLFNGAFPGSVSQMTARIDLSSEISAPDATTFSLSVLRSGNTEYVLLYSSSGFDGSKNHLYVLTPSLTVQNRFTMDDISALSPPGMPLKGDAAFTHRYDGKIVIGNLQASPNTNGLSLDGKLEPPDNPVSVQMRNVAIMGPSTASVTWADFNTDGSGNLTFRQYANDWSSSFPQGHPVGRNYYLRDVFTNPEDDQANTALLVFDDGMNNTTYFLPVPKDPDMVNAFPGPALFDNPAYTSFSMTDLDTKHIYATADGIVAFEYRTHSLIHFTPTTIASPTAIHMGVISDALVMAFSFSGGYYCVWDPATRTLTRYEKWW